MIHQGGKPHKCKYCEKCFHVLSDCKEHEQIHSGDTPLTNEDKVAPSEETEPQQLSSTAEQSSNQLNTFSCWICQEELSSQELLIEHYDNHMIME